ncbi:MAG: NVEALA domain-containing protein [Tannerellaceae bacterium]|jgi:hypothetical protein|nr:NVEALA domain-containing protein [Tannerellaceae bacterium]
MKKKIMSIAFVVAIAVAAVWNFNQSKAEVELSDMALANVEALASGETIDPCYGYGHVYCSYNGIWVERQ